MDLLIDTHVLIWSLEGDRRFSAAARAAIGDKDNDLFVSAVTAWEFADLRRRGRLPGTATFDLVLDLLAPTLLDLPGDLWRQSERLPTIHGDPADRMLVAHVLVSGMTLVTADDAIRRYPIPTLW